jgi:Fe-S-cluster containining protein
MITEPWHDGALQALATEYAAATEDAPQHRPVEATQRHNERYETRIAAQDAAEPVACRSGCAHCCHLRVSVRPHEAFMLAAALRDKPAEELASLRAALEHNAARIRTLSATEHTVAQVRCAFLGTGNTCRVYEHRPSACRRYHSTSVEACKASFDRPHDLRSRIPISNPRIVASLTMELAYRKVLIEQQRDTTPYELHTAVLEALNDAPACSERWASGDAPALVQALPGEAPEQVAQGT